MRVARCIVTCLHANVIEATMYCGPCKGEVILLPRIPLIPSDSELPFQFCCLQFPCKPCFSMSVYQQVTSPDIQGHWSGPFCPMFHPWAASYMSLSLGLAAHPNLAYSYHTIRRAMWSTQKTCRTEEWFIMLLDFYISLAMEGHLIYINCPMYSPGKAGNLHYLLRTESSE